MKTLAIIAFLFAALNCFSQTTATVGQPVTLTASIAVGTPPYTYQWMKSGVAVTGAPNASQWKLAAAALTDAGSYSISVKNSAGSATSPAVTLTVNPVVVGTPPVFTTQPLSQSVPVGGTASFSVNEDGVISVQWFRNGVAISGANSNLLTIPNVQLTDGGSVFTCVATNKSGSVTSNPATLTVTQVVVAPGGVSITVQVGA